MTHHRATVSVGISLATLIGLGMTDRAVADRKKACELLSAAELTQMVGFKFDAGVPDGAKCSWEGSRVAGRPLGLGVWLTLYDAQTIQRMFQSNSQPSESYKVEPIPGVGSKAIGTHYPDVAEYNVIVVDGQGGFQLIIHNARPNIEQTIPLGAALAKLAESRR